MSSLFINKVNHFYCLLFIVPVYIQHHRRAGRAPPAQTRWHGGSNTNRSVNPAVQLAANEERCGNVRHGGCTLRGHAAGRRAARRHVVNGAASAHVATTTGARHDAGRSRRPKDNFGEGFDY
jgi:hypothetical protein